MLYKYRKLWFVLLALILAAAGWWSRDILLEPLLKEALAHQALTVFSQQVHLSDLRIDSSEGKINTNQISFMALDDPLQQPGLTARAVELQVNVSGVFSRHVQVHQAHLYDAEVVLEYIAPGVSNLRMLEQSYRNHLARREAKGKSRLLEWELEKVRFERLRFRLIDYDGQQLANVTLPHLELSSLASSNSPEENLKAVLYQLQLELLEHLLLGRVEGDYDLKAIVHLTGRELPKSRLIKQLPMQKAKESGLNLIKGMFK